jgi:hypothetical protein
MAELWKPTISHSLLYVSPGFAQANNALSQTPISTIEKRRLRAAAASTNQRRSNQ